MPEPEVPSNAVTHESEAPISFAEFLESVPPSQTRLISQIVEISQGSHEKFPTGEVLRPEILLHCSSDACNGMRFFRPVSASKISGINSSYGINGYLIYVCSNCQQNSTTFSLRIIRGEGDTNISGLCSKFGEDPAYGPPTPARLISMLGPGRDLYLKGRQCENQGLGIGAFVYYRRVIEDQKDRLLESVAKVADQVGNGAVADTLRTAKAETQFSRAMASVKDAVPETLRINGYNPLTLLHSALSEGLHAQTDGECLELAKDIRLVLAELSERISQALKDERELNEAVKRLGSKG